MMGFSCWSSSSPTWLPFLTRSAASDRKSSALLPCSIYHCQALLTRDQVTGCVTKTRAYVLDLWLVHKVPQLLLDLWRRILQPVVQVVQVHHHLPAAARAGSPRIPLGQHCLQPHIETGHSEDFGCCVVGMQCGSGQQDYLDLLGR